MRGRALRLIGVGFLATTLALFSSGATAQVCELPDNGSGTVNLPPNGCPYTNDAESRVILEGFAGDTIEVAVRLSDFFNIQKIPGGSLGGEITTFNAILVLDMQGTGSLSAFARLITMTVGCEIHSALPPFGKPFQQIPLDLVTLQGQLFGDADFEFLQVLGGSRFGLGSIGETRLFELPNTHFNVDSSIDLSCEIEFVSAPGGALAGLSGVSTASTRIRAGSEPPVAANDTCDRPMPIGEGDTPFSANGSSTDGPSPCGDLDWDLWFTYTATCDGVSTITTCNQANIDTVIAVYPDGPCLPTPADAIRCNDDGDTCGPTSTVSFLAQSGQTYLVQVGGAGNGLGSGMVTVSCDPPPSSACSGGPRLTHSASSSVVPQSSIACTEAATGFHRNTSYWRSFTPNQPPFGLFDPMAIERVEFGVESAVSPQGSQPVIVRIYRDPTPPEVAPVSELELLGEQTVDVPDVALELFCAQLTPAIPIGTGQTFVVEIFTPDGVADGNSFRIGANDGGETGRSLFSAADCGVMEPTPSEVAGGPVMHLVTNVYWMPATSAYSFLRGDCNGNGVYAPLGDALYCLRFGLADGPPPPCMEAAEADGNGGYNPLIDPLYSLNYGFLGGAPPPAPFPLCGTDPDPGSSLGCAPNDC